MIGGKLPTRPHTAPNSFRRGRILKAKDDTGHAHDNGRRDRSPGGRNRVLKGSNIFNSTASGAHDSPRGQPDDSGDPDSKLSGQRTVSPRSRRRIRQINGTYGPASPRLPGIGTGADDAGATPRGRAGLRGPSPRRRPSRGPAGNGVSPRGMNGNPRQFATHQAHHGWQQGAVESVSTVSSAKVSPRQRQDQPASPPSSPPQQSVNEAKEVGMDILETTQQAELQELQLDLDACRSAAAKAEAEKELAEVQIQVMQQECEMETKRMARENQILQDELDEMKARFRSLQEEHDKKVRAKDRYIQVLLRALEVHNIASPLVAETEADQSIDSLTSRIVSLAGSENGFLQSEQFAAVTELCGLPAFFESRLVKHAQHVGSAGDDSRKISVSAFVKMWRTRLYPLDEAQRMFRLLANPTGGSECITTTALQPVICEILTLNPQLAAGTAVRFEDKSTNVEGIAAVLSQRIMHFCCRAGVRRMSRADYDSSDLGEVLQILAQGGDNASSSVEKVAAFFAIEEADQVVACFAKLDDDKDGFIAVQNLLTARNAGGQDGEAGLIPRCGAFTLTQAAIEGVFGRCSSGSQNLMDLGGFTELFHAYVYPHAPCAMRFWFDVADSDHDGRIKPDDIERLLQEQVFILNTHLESQGEAPVFHLDNLMQQVMDMLGAPRGMASGMPAWCCAEVLSSRAGLVVFDILFNYEVLLRYERQATATGGQPYITCALSS
eukprot:SAG11_NODE_219_length_12168_cov_5.600083_3_plen_722_part_00